MRAVSSAFHGGFGRKKAPKLFVLGGFFGVPLLSVRVARVVLGRDRYELRFLPFYFAFCILVIRVGDGRFALAADGRQNESCEQEWKSALH